MANLRRSVEAFARRAPHDAEDLRGAIARLEPGALLVDVNAWGAMAAAEASGLPWAVWSPYPLPLPSRDVPPFGPGSSRLAASSVVCATPRCGPSCPDRWNGCTCRASTRCARPSGSTPSRTCMACMAPRMSCWP